jgi:hypothetical protein
MAQAAADHTVAVADHAAVKTPGNVVNNFTTTVGWKSIAAVVIAATLGFFTGQFVHTGVPGSSPQSASSRDPYVQPFTSTSIWNQPIGSSAVYVASGIKPLTQKAVTTDQTVLIQDPSAPSTPVLQNKGQHSDTCLGAGALGSDPIPSALVVPASNHNNGFAAIQSDGQTIDEGGAFARCVAGGTATAGHLAAYGTLFGDGLTGGAGGSKLSTLGGLLRPGEIAPGKVEVPHALRVNIDCPVDCTPSSPGFRWPATKKDSYAYSPGGTVGALSMGALLAVPPAFNCSTLGLAGAELCRTLQDYGGYVANDSAQSVFALNTEQGDANTAAQFQSDWGFPLATAGATGAGWANDVQTIVRSLAVVDNNGPNNIGGGGTPRQPLAAPLATSCLTAARLTAFTSTPMDPDADGDSDFTEAPDATASPSATPSPTASASMSPSPTSSPSASASASPCPTPTASSPTPTPSSTGTPGPTPTPTSTVPPTPTPTLASGTPHVMVIIEENKGAAATLGTCSADPYACSLAAKYASFSNSHGITHPSEPNYVAFESGGIQGCTTDSSCAANSVSATDLGGQLTAAGMPWVSWMESMPSPCYTGGSSGLYVLKHSFGGFFKDNYGGACNIQPYPGSSAAISTLNGANAPDFVWISPNLNNDAHNGTVQQMDAWLSANLAPILASNWFTGFPSTVVWTMDEGDAGSTNLIPTVVISNNGLGKGHITTSVNHYSVLRAIELAYGLPLLGGAATASDMTGVFG